MDVLGIILGSAVEIKISIIYSHNEIPQNNRQIIIDL